MDLARDAKRSSRLNDPWMRGLIYQALLVVCVGALVSAAVANAVINMRARGIPMGFGFWNQVAGFEINLHLIDYSGLSTYGRAFWVGLLNTLLIGVISIPLATVLGFAIGVARLSPNWLLSRCALVYTNVLRNIPLLLLLLFWYNAVLKSLPGPRQSLSVGDVVFLNNRGFYLPRAVPRDEAVWFFGAIVVGLACTAAFHVWSRRRQERTGAQAPTTLIALALIIGLPAIVAAASPPFTFDIARLSGFNLKGGLQIIPEMAALVFGLVTFTAAFIAEIVRAGVLAVPHDNETHRHSASDASHHAAAHVAIPEHRQEFVARRVHRLSGPRADFRRHGSQSDAGGSAGDGGHHGGLFGHLASGRCRA
jgi:general L-amino acid transport system permease protein